MQLYAEPCNIQYQCWIIYSRGAQLILMTGPPTNLELDTLWADCGRSHIQALTGPHTVAGQRPCVCRTGCEI